VALVTYAGGLGAVPEPEHPDLWAAERQVVVVDAATGRGVTAPIEGPIEGPIE
jgi:hypothetical protein